MPPTSIRDPRPPQDSTIFIASLPPQFDQQELAGHLRNHFVQFAQIHNINVVRDSNGAACAFVQCHSSTEAAQLIKSVRETEFFGRVLRAEPARALRTLLVSYRMPKQDFHPHQTTLELPVSIKLSKPKTSKFYTITYNESVTQVTPDELSISPLLFDKRELEKLAMFFGPLEDFKALDRQPPYPHNTVRSPTMDSQCYEIKWAYREDCVAALTTLKRVPHLTVTWSHQRRNNQYSEAPRSVPVTAAPWSDNDFPPLAGSGAVKPAQGVWDRPLFKPQVTAADLSVSSDMSLETVSSATGTEGATSGQSVEYAAIYTPSLAMSPLTPLTPPNQQLATPIDPPPHLDFARLSLSKSDNYFSNPSEAPGTRSPPVSSNIDPLSIFVGGLNTYGPTAWSEEKVAEHFGKYGTMQGIKFLHPSGQRTAFAFVTYDNPEAAVHAVQKENNKVYNNRTIRVQLREVNPPRSPWKSHRNRERTPDRHSSSGSSPKASSVTSLREVTAAQLNTSIRATEPSPPPPAVDTSHFREWYEIEPIPTVSPAPFPPAAYSGAGYPVPPWVHFPGHFQYPMGFYPGYAPVPVAHTSLYHPATMDSAGMSGTTQTPVSWVHYPSLAAVHTPPVALPSATESYMSQYHTDSAPSANTTNFLTQPSSAPSSDRSSTTTPQQPPMPIGWQTFKQVPIPAHPHAAIAPWMSQPLVPPWRGLSAAQSNQAHPAGRGDLHNRRRLSLQHVSGTRGRGRVYGLNRITPPGRDNIYDLSNEAHWVPGT